MKILLIGAGAVGQSYGRHLQLGGADVSFFVRPKYADEARAGYTMYPLTLLGNDWKPVRFEGFGVCTTADEVAAETWDQVWICVSATALRGSWLVELLAAAGDAVVVMFSPGLADRDLILEQWPHPDRLVQGVITSIAWHAPLPGKTLEAPGMAYLFPPLSPNPFSGPEGPTRAAVDALLAGGCPAKVHPDVSTFSGFGSATLNTIIAALEAAGWSFADFRRGRYSQLAARAGAEARAVVVRELDVKEPLSMVVAKPFVIRWVSWLAPFVMPMDIEVYLQAHFTKVGDQTRFVLDTYRRLGEQYGLPTPALDELAGLLAERDAA